MIRDEYPEYFTKTGQIKRNISSEDKLFIRQKLLDFEGREILIAEGSGTAKEKHLFDCVVCEHSWNASLDNVCNNGHGCPNCSSSISDKERSLEKCKQAAPAGYTVIDIPEFSGVKSYVHYTCDKGHFVDTTSVNNFLTGRRCPECAHQDKDTIYLYELGNTGIFKVGITSERLGMYRINSVAKTHNATPMMVLLEKKVSCRDIETTILDEFSHKRAVDMVGDGATEMFEFSESDIFRIKEIVNASE